MSLGTCIHFSLLKLKRALWCALLSFLASVFPVLLSAQFQQPTAEELKMTADPKAPGAAAVYLNREETTDDQSRYRTIYERIKVLTEKGKETATIRIPYAHGVDKVTDVEGRTIHADGTVIPLTAKPDDLMNYKVKGYQLNAIVFTLPNVEVGCILEYRLRIHSSGEGVSTPTWEIQQPFFVHSAHYSFRPSSFGRIMYSARMRSDAKVIYNKENTYVLDINDIPPQFDEDWMPPVNTLSWHVEFYWSYFASGSAFWKQVQQNWDSWVRDFTKPTGKLRDALATVTAPGDPEEAKAKEIYAAVMKLENTDFTRRKSEVERKKDKLKDIGKAEDVWKQQAGSSDEIALLYVALARTAGLKAWPMQVVNRDRALFDSGYLSTYQLDDFIAVIEIGGKEIYLDPGQKMCPFGSLHWKHALATGFKQTPKEAVIAMTPASTFKNAIEERTANLSIDESGNVQGTVQFILNGPDALFWRQLALKNDEAEAKKRFNESVRELLPEGVQSDFDHFLGLDDPSVNLIAIIKVSGSLGTFTGKHLFLPELFFESRAKHPFVAQDKRIVPVDVHFARLEQDDVEYDLPRGFKIEDAPQPADISWPNRAQFKVGSHESDGSVTIRRAMAYNFTLLDPKEYADLHDFFLKVAAADQQQIILTASSTPKAN